MSMEISITQITLVATKVAMHVGVPVDKADEVEQQLLPDGLADSVTQNETGWGGDEEVVHIVIEVFAFCVTDLVSGLMFQGLIDEGILHGDDNGNVLQITDQADWDEKIIELPSEALVG